MRQNGNPLGLLLVLTYTQIIQADMPITRIKHQAQTTAPVTVDTTLVDDTSRLVDDTTALVGGPNSPIENLSVAIDNFRPKVIIKIRR